MSVRLHIERLVVEGLDASELPMLREALEEALSRQLAADAVALAQVGGRTALLRRAQNRLPPAPITGAALGSATAHALHQELLRWDD